MGLHSRLFRSSSSLLKLTNLHDFANSINNPFHHIIPKQSLRLHHHDSCINTNEDPRNKFVVGIRPHKDFHEGAGADSYLSLLSFNGEFFSPEKNFYFRSPSAQPLYHFSVIGDTSNNTELSTDIFHPPFDIRLVNSCNGLICLQGDTRDGKVVIWNPLIDEFKVLDYSPVKRPHFASHTRSKCAGFGFDHEAKDYKAVMRVDNFYENKDVDGISMGYINAGSDGHYEACSLKTGSWWPLPEPQYEPSISPGDSVYMDGFCYWKARTDDDDHSFSILGFDFANEIFFVFPGPPTDAPMGPHTFSLLEYKGFLAFLLYPKFGFEKMNSELWVREKDGTWSKVDGFSRFGHVKKVLAWGSDQWFYEGICEEDIMLCDATGREETLGSMYGFTEKIELVPYVESTTSPIHPMEN